MTGNRPKGFKPNALEGDMYDKKVFGLKVPAEEEYDAQNQTHLTTRNGKAIPTETGDMFRDGFIRIDVGKIRPAVQDAYNDSGKVKPIHPSQTASGHLRKVSGRGKEKTKRY